MKKIDHSDYNADGTLRKLTSGQARPANAPPPPPARSALSARANFGADGKHVAPKTPTTTKPAVTAIAGDWVPVVTVEGFKAQRGDAETLMAHGVSVLIRDGLLVLRRNEVTRAVNLLAAVNG